MSLQYRFFHIRATESHDAEEELNRFLVSVRVVNIHREFVDQGGNSFWSVAVEYLTPGTDKPSDSKGKGKPKVDYHEILSSEDFAVFAKLRDWRKETAEKEGAPVYTVFTNEQLAKIAEKCITAKNALLEIDGIGEARVGKYGDAVISIVKQSKQTGDGKQAKNNETIRKPLPADTGLSEPVSGIPESRREQTELP